MPENPEKGVPNTHFGDEECGSRKHPTALTVKRMLVNAADVKDWTRWCVNHIEAHERRMSDCPRLDCYFRKYVPNLGEVTMK